MAVNHIGRVQNVTVIKTLLQWKNAFIRVSYINIYQGWSHNFNQTISLYCLKIVPRTTTEVIVTPRVVSVVEMMYVTVWLVTALMDVNHIGRDLGVMV